jgi:predicted nucleotidyltransferase
MYLEPLTKTSTEILAFLSSRIQETFTVRQISEAIGKDYKITYTMTMRLAEQRYIIAEKKRPVTYCRLNLKGNSPVLAYIEGVRASRFFQKYKDIEILVNDLISKISLPFFTLIVFGSYVKGTASPRSDLDVLLIIPERSFEQEVETAVGSVQRVSPLGIHETVLAYSEFLELLKQKKPNVAWEAIDNRIVPYGAQMLLKILEQVL